MKGKVEWKRSYKGVMCIITHPRHYDDTYQRVV